MTSEQRAAASAVIVIGVLTEIRSDAERPNRRIGLIAVDRVLKGDADLDSIPLLLPPANGPRSGDQIDYAPGAAGMWFLRSLGPRAPGLYAADHPQRFVPESRMEAEGLGPADP